MRMNFTFFIFLFSILTPNLMIKAQETKIIAHRGYWKTDKNAQNSLKSLREAGKQNFYGSEFDVYITKDNVLVVNHDADINGKNIETSTYKTISKEKLKNGEILPTLKTYLTEGKKYPNLKLIIEIKNHQDESRENKAVEEIVKLVSKMGVMKQVEYISFSSNICNQLKIHHPTAIVSYLEGDLSPSEVKALNWDGIDYNYSIYQKNPNWIREAHDLGLRTNVWTINKPEMMVEMIEQKIQFISTDEPKVLKDIIKKMVWNQSPTIKAR